MSTRIGRPVNSGSGKDGYFACGLRKVSGFRKKSVFFTAGWKRLFRLFM
jgi:hypothetical protein